MSRFALRPLGELLDPVNTWNPLRENPDETFSYIDLSAVDQEKKQITGTREVLCSEAPSRARQIVRSNDVLVSTVRPNLNGVAKVPTELDAATASTGFCVLRPKPSLLDSNFLFHWVKSPLFVSDMVSKATGASYPAVSDKIVGASLFPCPQLPEQRRIAAILDQADALRAKRREALAQLDGLTQSIFIEMFGDPITNPKNWHCCSVGEVTDCIVPGRDKPKSFSGETPWITTENLAHLDFTNRSPKSLGLSQSEIGEVRARVIPAGSVVLSCVGNLGITTIAAVEMVINQQLHSFQCHEQQVNNLYLMYCLAAQTAFMYAKASSTTLPYMNKSVCNSIPVQIPPIELQKLFAARVLAIQATKKIHADFLIELDTLFASLQHRAFRGEL